MVIYRSEGVCHRNGLFHSCACGRVAGGELPGVGWAIKVCRAAAAAAAAAAASPHGGRCFSGYVSGDGVQRDAFS